MVIDKITNAQLYYGLGKRITLALKYLKETDFSGIEPGRYEIDGSNVYALVQVYESKLPDTGKWEGHRKYIDIQYVAEGSELIGYANIERMKTICGYDEEKDFILFEGKGDFLSVPAGTFALLWPHDVHMPGIAADIPRTVKKVIVKVRV
jgi:YhcH/YjgK/YiaL family protein